MYSLAHLLLITAIYFLHLGQDERRTQSKFRKVHNPQQHQALSGASTLQESIHGETTDKPSSSACEKSPGHEESACPVPSLEATVQPCLRKKGWTVEQLEIATGKKRKDVLEYLDQGQVAEESLWTIEHPLHLSSAYRYVCGEEPCYTTVHTKAKSTVDFVFFTDKPTDGVVLEATGVLQVPSHPPKCLPSREFPSDHVFLLVELRARVA